MIYVHLIIEFVKISLFSFGGGYGTLPFIYYISYNYGWFSVKEIMQMVALAAVTPGAFGVNMATYTGFKVAGFLGAILATMALIIPAYFLVILVYKTIKKYHDTILVKDFLEILRSIAAGLLFTVFLRMLNQEILHVSLSKFSMNFDLNAFILLCITIITYFCVKKSIPLTMILSVIFGVILKQFMPL